MCTALSLTTKDHYFGRNLDLDVSYGEEICVMPRNFPLTFRKAGKLAKHHAIIGMATVVDGLPLFYEGVNEHGLSMAGLNFPNNAQYYPSKRGKDNVAPFELIPWILGKCKSVENAKKLLARLNVVNVAFSEKLPLSPLHWIIADKNKSIVVETTADGMQVYDNPVGVLTNNPPFPLQLFNLNNYRHLGVDNGENKLSQNIQLDNYCQGLGALGLPGDVSSMSRFVRIVFGRENSLCADDEMSSVGQFFHLLTSVAMVQGQCRTPSGRWDITGYTCCVNTTKGIYYYTTYGNRQISCVDMRKTDLNSNEIFRFSLAKEQQIYHHN